VKLAIVANVYQRSPFPTCIELVDYSPHHVCRFCVDRVLQFSFRIGRWITNSIRVAIEILGLLTFWSIPSIEVGA